MNNKIKEKNINESKFLIQMKISTVRLLTPIQRKITNCGS